MLNNFKNTERPFISELFLTTTEKLNFRKIRASSGQDQDQLSNYKILLWGTCVKVCLRGVLMAPQYPFSNIDM